MGFKIQYGDIADYAGLGVLAGKATAAREAVQRQAAMDRQVMQIQAQRASQERAQAHQKEMNDFDDYMDNMRYQASEAWELEKMGLRSRHDFEMVEAKREMDFQNQMQREQRQQQEMDAKLKAINEAEHLSPTERKDAIIKVRTGVTIPRKKRSPLETFLGEQPVRTGQPIGPQTQPMVNSLRSAMSNLDEASQKQLREIIARGNPAQIKAAYDRVKKTVAPGDLDVGPSARNIYRFG